MRPFVYITAAILATVAGYMVVYVNFMPHGNEGQSENSKGTGKFSDSIAKEPKKEVRKAQKPEKSPSDTTGNVVTGDDLRGLNTGHMTTFVVRQKPQDLPEFEFFDETGNRKTLADWSGKVVLLNLWATWCAPCRKEMPALDMLKAKLGGDNFDVVAISIDRGGIEKPLKFFQEISVKNLVMYHDRTSRLGGTLRAFGMPTTVLIDRNGKEIGRLVGPAEWDSEDAIRLLKAAIESKDKK